MLAERRVPKRLCALVSDPYFVIRIKLTPMARTPRIGRRRRNPRHVADVLVAVRLTPAERAAFQRLADSDGLSLSELIRRLCMAEITRHTRRRKAATTRVRRRRVPYGR